MTALIVVLLNGLVMYWYQFDSDWLAKTNAGIVMMLRFDSQVL